MQIIVLIKQVPEMDRVKFDSEKGVIDRKSAGVEINPFDLNALETAVQIKEKVGGEIIALTMGPPRAEKTLREAIARGADRGILLSDGKFAGADTRSTSFTLAHAIKKIGPFDLVIAGEMTVDGDTAQVGPQTAEYLDIPHIAYVTGLDEITALSLTVTCNIWDGSYRKRLHLPGLITVTKDINFPRLPELKNKMRAREVEIPRWDFSTLSDVLSPEDTGLKGSPTQVKKITIPPPVERKGQVFSAEEMEKALAAIEKICREKQISGGQS